MTPKRRIDVEDLIENENLLFSQSFHLICSPSRCIEICIKLQQTLSSLKNKAPKRPIIIWEPVPGVISPDTFSECIKAIQYVDIFSPNAKEAAEFLGEEEPFEEEDIKNVALKFLVHMEQRTKGLYEEKEKEKEKEKGTVLQPQPPRSVVIRCGSKGCAVFAYEKFPTSKIQNPKDKGILSIPYYEGWFPAYHNSKFPDFKVEDPTGGGNTFLGGFIAGYMMGTKSRDVDDSLGGSSTCTIMGNLARAAVYGNVAASFAIEQVGVPRITSNGINNSSDGSNNGKELWNNESVEARVNEYLIRYSFSSEILD